MTRSTQRFALASLAILLGVGIVTALLFLPVPEHNRDLFYVLSGVVLGWGGTAMAYYFGTSESSNQKTEIMERMKGQDQ